MHYWVNKAYNNSNAGIFRVVSFIPPILSTNYFAKVVTLVSGFTWRKLDEQEKLGIFSQREVVAYELWDQLIVYVWYQEQG